jgi:hypothetical protein
MSKVPRVLVSGVLGLVPITILTFALSMLWWNAWMYEGWPAPSGRVAASLIKFDEVYSDVMAEIVVLSFFVTVIGAAVFSKLIHWTLKKHRARAAARS